MKAIMCMALVLLAGGARAGGPWLTWTQHDGDFALYIPGSRNFYDGNGLWAQCDRTAQSYSRATCRDYILGVADVLASQNGNNVCLAPNATEGQLADIVTKYLRDNPELRHYQAQTLIEIALTIAFPCPKATKQPNWMSAPVVKPKADATEPPKNRPSLCEIFQDCH